MLWPHNFTLTCHTVMMSSHYDGDINQARSGWREPAIRNSGWLEKTGQVECVL